MDLGINKVIDEGNGNTIIYTALLAAMVANTLPTPFDGIYFRRVNTLERKFDEGTITAKRKNIGIATEYYLWTSLWYGALFTGIYAFGGKYKTNAKIILGLSAVGFVIGAVQKNIQIDEKIMSEKNSKNVR
jgi:hypothetical protein